MSSSNCCFLTCIQSSQEAGQVVWYSHLLKNFPQFVAIHIVKSFGIVNEADVFLELSCFFNDPADVGNLISRSSAFSKSSLNILKEDVVKVLHSICQLIWKTQQWPQDWKSSVFIPVSKKGNAKECSNYCTTALISHTSKVMLKILQARFQQYFNQPYVYRYSLSFVLPSHLGHHRALSSPTPQSRVHCLIASSH